MTDRCQDAVFGFTLNRADLKTARQALDRAAIDLQDRLDSESDYSEEDRRQGIALASRFLSLAERIEEATR